MNILIIADRLLAKEITQNGIDSYLSIAIRAAVEIRNFFNSNDLSRYDYIILWTHPEDDKDYKIIGKRFINIRFPREIKYWRINSTLNKPWLKMELQHKEQPDYYFPSKYKKALQVQAEELTKIIKQTV